ncbi:MAG TPA: T9SS type A sorting domain-containing protein [Candidatus Kapabacteria bacterium]|nr:T9SS type A sorting domain-containing protein [Candidatus Kapabacteria bacterium]
MKAIFVIGLLLLIAPLNIFAQENSSADSPFSKILNRDGTIGPNSGSGKSFDTRGYKMRLGKNSEPHFFPAAQVPDEWDSISHKPGYFDGIDNNETDAITSDGDDLYIGGSFEWVGANHAYNIIHYNRSTETWSTLGDGFNGTVLTLKVIGGKLYAGGKFTEAGGSSAPMQGIAVWDGTSWSQLGGGVDGIVNAITTMDTSVIIGGDFSKAGGANSITAGYVARWNGHKWDDMGAALNDVVRCFMTTGDSLFVGGDFWISDLRRIALYRKGQWQGLGTALDGSVYTMAMYKGKLWAGGDFFYTFDVDYQKPVFCLATFDGTDWSAFGSGSNIGLDGGIVNTILVVGDSMYIGGSFATVAGVKAHGIIKFSNGVFSDVHGGVDGYVRCLAVYNKQIYVGGTFYGVGNSGLFISSPATLIPGDLWGAAEGSGVSGNGGYSETSVNAVAVTDKYIFIGGAFTKIGSTEMHHIAMWDKQLRKWNSLGGFAENGVDDDVYVIVIQGSKVYVGGDFNQAETTIARHIAYWDMNTSTWHAMGSGSQRNIHAITANENGVYASVFFDLEDHDLNNYIGRWDGSKWNRIDGKFKGFINAIAVKDTVLCIGGLIGNLNNMNYANIAIHYPSGWIKLGDGLDNVVAAITFGVDVNDVYATGLFGYSGSLALYGIGHWDGVQWYNIGGGLNNFGFSLAWDGKNIFTGGRFTKAGGKAANYLAKWDMQNWSEVGGGTDFDVRSLAVDSKNLYCGGDFSYVNNDYLSYRFAILHFGSSSVAEGSDANTFSVSVNPNVISTTTTITVTSPRTTEASVEIVNVLGALIRPVETKHIEGGETQFTIDARGLASGTYFIRIKAAGAQKMGKIIIE